jgi:hypothetical protein
MPSRRFYAANILSALTWAPAHVFPGVLLGMALNLAGLSPGRLAILLIIGLIAVSAAVQALRSYLNRHLVLDHHAAAPGVMLEDGCAHAGLDKIRDWLR